MEKKKILRKKFPLALDIDRDFIDYIYEEAEKIIKEIGKDKVVYHSLTRY